MKKVAVLQSNYLPWKGYFDIIRDVDVFVFYDEVQYTKNDWRNRNKIRTPEGTKWLTIPCGYDLNRKIEEVKIKNEIAWQDKHYNDILRFYSDAPYFNYIEDFLDLIYKDKKWEYLSELNQYCIKYICQKFLDIDTMFVNSREYKTSGEKGEKLLSLLKCLETDLYVSGPAAKSYISEEKYYNNGIKIIWKNYEKYPEYSQVYPGFEHHVSIIDMLANLGKMTKEYI